jgi:hypothetical protein
VSLRGYEWELPPQDFALDWTKTPPVAADGLRAVVRRRPDAAARVALDTGPTAPFATTPGSLPEA